jgi:hypothetical protein
MTYDPGHHLESLEEELKAYLVSRFAAAYPGVDFNQVYDIVWDYPTAEALPGDAEFKKTIIHFSIDDVDPKRLGLGPGRVTAEIVDGTPLTVGTVTEHEAMSNIVNFDVGIWASDLSGGVSSRLKAYQWLQKFFATDNARRACWEFTQGVEIKFYRSGRFVTEAINDVRVFRVVGAELEVRVFSRDDADPDILVDQEPTQQPELEIQGDDGSLVNLVDS